MLPSSTVENYLKAIYQGQLQLAGDARLVPMGQVASMLGVTPDLATQVELGPQQTSVRVGNVRLHRATTIAQARGPPVGSSP